MGSRAVISLRASNTMWVVIGQIRYLVESCKNHYLQGLKFRKTLDTDHVSSLGIVLYRSWKN